jgi:hypothetical protein
MSFGEVQSKLGPATQAQSFPEHLNLPRIDGILMLVKGPAEHQQA